MATAERFSGISLREVREEDAEEVAQLFRVVFGEGRPVDAEQVVSWVRNRELKPEWLRVVELDRRIVGYGDIAIDERGRPVPVVLVSWHARLTHTIDPDPGGSCLPLLSLLCGRRHVASGVFDEHQRVEIAVRHEEGRRLPTAAPALQRHSIVKSFRSALAVSGQRSVWNASAAEHQR